MKNFEPYRSETSDDLTTRQEEKVVDIVQQQIADFAGTSTYRRGIVTGVTVDGITLTAASVGFTIAGGSTIKTFTCAGNLTTSGGHDLVITTSASTNVTLPTSGTLTSTSNKLSVFAATTSAELAGVISDETGSGALVFATSPAFTTPSLGAASCASINVSNGATGSFTTVDGKTVTVSAGIITAIV